MSENKGMKWMYDGPKSLVNREDYLLGKRIDKNFELFSDVVVKEKNAESIDRLNRKLLEPSTLSGGAVPSSLDVLGLDVVRTEDPLVAIRLQQEQRKRTILENPLLRMKVRRILKQVQTEKRNKKQKKKSKRERFASSSSSASSADIKQNFKRNMKKHRSNSIEDCNSQSVAKRRHRRESSTDCRKVTRKNGNDKGGNCRRYSQCYRNATDEKEPRKRSRSPRGSRRPSDSRSHQYHHRDDRRVERRKTEYINEVSRRGARRERRPSSSPPSDSLPRPTQSSPSLSKKLTKEEIEKKRRAMMSNVQWRDELRNKVIENAATKLRDEERIEMEQANSNGVAALIGTVASASTSVAQRLQTKKHTLQRSHDYMERSFMARK